MPILSVFFPGLGALIAGLFGFRIGDRFAQLITTGLVSLSALISIFLFYQTSVHDQIYHITLFRWFDIGLFKANWSIYIDRLTAIMLLVITGISSLVHIYSWGYMSHDESKWRFFCYLSLFTFAMLVLVTADNFIQLFFGWEGVGLASYLLIGFWYKKPSANLASIKAFVTNRVGDAGFVLGIIVLYWLFGSLEFNMVFSAIAEYKTTELAFLGFKLNAIELIAFLLFIGAMGKSAQLFLHVWLADAMEGPTPVSALIHAATMVTAGVFLVCRASPIYEFAPYTSNFMTLIGSLTALFSASIALTQNDIKRVIAYSTCSQLGYMFFAAGLGAYNIAIFHLFTHAFFKALLFLGAGSVIHGLSDEQDMRNMGGLAKVMPVTWMMMIIGTLALTGVGIPMSFLGFSGFFSKDAIIEIAYSAWEANHMFAGFAFFAGILAAFMTSFYSWRLILMTFHGSYRGKKKILDHAHESPLIMLIPLLCLALGAIFAGGLFYNLFFGHYFSEFWHSSLYFSKQTLAVIKSAHHVPVWVKWSPFIVMLAGFFIAFYLYFIREESRWRVGESKGILYTLLYHKWYFDELYTLLFVKPVRYLGLFFWKIGDQKILDGLGPDGIASSAKKLSKYLKKIQSGYMYHYAFAMLLGIAILTSWVLISSGQKGVH